MITLSEIHKFQLFCLENYKISKKISGKEALKEFEQTAVFSFLADGYKVLHTQGLEYIIAQITDFIERRK